MSLFGSSDYFTDFQVHIDFLIPLLCDNKSAIHFARNPVVHERTIHVEIKCHIVRSHVTSNLIVPIHTSKSEQHVDLLTKAILNAQLQYLISKLGVRSSLHSHLEGGIWAIIGVKRSGATVIEAELMNTEVLLNEQLLCEYICVYF